MEAGLLKFDRALAYCFIFPILPVEDTTLQNPPPLLRDSFRLPSKRGTFTA